MFLDVAGEAPKVPPSPPPPRSNALDFLVRRTYPPLAPTTSEAAQGLAIDGSDSIRSLRGREIVAISSDILPARRLQENIIKSALPVKKWLAVSKQTRTRPQHNVRYSGSKCVWIRTSIPRVLHSQSSKIFLKITPSDPPRISVSP